MAFMGCKIRNTVGQLFDKSAHAVCLVKVVPVVTKQASFCTFIYVKPRTNFMEHITLLIANTINIRRVNIFRTYKIPMTLRDLRKRIFSCSVQFCLYNH